MSLIALTNEVFNFQITSITYMNKYKSTTASIILGTFNFHTYKEKLSYQNLASAPLFISISPMQMQEAIETVRPRFSFAY